MVEMISRSGSRATPKRRMYRSATASRSFGMPRLDEYRWFRALWAASLSFSTATSGDGRSGLPNPRSTTSTPARRASTFNPSMMVKTYGGRFVIRRNSMGRTLGGPSRPAPHRLQHPGCGAVPVAAEGSPGTGRRSADMLGPMAEHTDFVPIVVEIPRGSRNKYEIDHETGEIWLDRRLFSATVYPADYGYVDHTLGED